VGNLRKYVAAGTPVVTFEIGDSGAYTPASVAFASVTIAGDLKASTTGGDHASIAGSLINSAKSVNRYWTLTNSGITFTTATTTFTFVAGDVDAGANTNLFFADEYSSSTWVGPQFSARSSTSTSATYVSAFGDFVVGEPKVAAPSNLTASGISTRRVDMSWTDNSSTETGYEIEKGTTATSYSSYTTTAANATAQSVTGLTANTTYYLRIRTVTASGNSPWVYTSAATLVVPTATADAYTTSESVTLLVTAPGLLTNDPDGTNGFYTTTKASDPSHGSVTVNTDGSFSYAPTGGYTGTDSFTYKVNDGALQSTATTVTITINTSAYVSSSAWPTSANSSRYLQLDFPAYLPTSATVSGATFTHTYRSYNGVGTTCYYVEVYSGATLLATHGSSGSPVSCNSTGSFATDNVSLPEINTAGRANSVRVRLIIWNSGGVQSEHRYAKVSINYYLN
jgi:VCBS repeat-containing protein